MTQEELDVQALVDEQKSKPKQPVQEFVDQAEAPK